MPPAQTSGRRVCVQGEWQNEGAHGRIRAWLRAKSHSLCDLEGANSLWSSFSSSKNEKEEKNGDDGDGGRDKNVPLVVLL